MSRYGNDHGYIEWDAEKPAPDEAGPRADDFTRVAELFDAEARRRFGELIAMAAQNAEKSKK